VGTALSCRDAALRLAERGASAAPALDVPPPSWPLQKVIVLSPSPGALALGATGSSSGAASSAGSLLSTLSSSLKEARGAAGSLTGAAAGGVPPGSAAGGMPTGAAALGQHQSLVAALHGRVAKVTAEVDELRRRVEKERAR
jgi:hypothetical protein